MSFYPYLPHGVSSLTRMNDSPQFPAKKNNSNNLVSKLCRRNEMILEIYIFIKKNQYARCCEIDTCMWTS